mmetsp:Transcript_2119/g.6031  ORF Transcript_2119/g.6031 Transcript_2119/m.6031 type:complete len:209 (+) Transcript_2119:442-1068(+)
MDLPVFQQRPEYVPGDLQVRHAATVATIVGLELHDAVHERSRLLVHHLSLLPKNPATLSVIEPRGSLRVLQEVRDHHVKQSKGHNHDQHPVHDDGYLAVLRIKDVAQRKTVVARAIPGEATEEREHGERDAREVVLGIWLEDVGIIAADGLREDDRADVAHNDKQDHCPNQGRRTSLDASDHVGQLVEHAGVPQARDPCQPDKPHDPH